MGPLWKSQGNLKESVLFSHHVGSEDCSRDIRLHGKHLYPLSLLVGSEHMFSALHLCTGSLAKLEVRLLETDRPTVSSSCWFYTHTYLRTSGSLWHSSGAQHSPTLALPNPPWAPASEFTAALQSGA